MNVFMAGDTIDLRPLDHDDLDLFCAMTTRPNLRETATSC